MQRRLFTARALEQIYRNAVRVLGEMGMKVESRQCLEAMERFGCRIDEPNERAIFSPEVIDRMLEMVRLEAAGWQTEPLRTEKEYAVGGGGTCPFYFDEKNGGCRRAAETDCVQAFKILETSAAVACEPPVSNQDCPPKFEAIRCLQLGIETLNKTVLGGTDLFFPEQVPFVVELGRLYRNDPAWFLPAGNCPNSPLCIGKKIAELAVVKAPYKKVYAVPTMPVAGANAPMTPAGTATIGVAEILGGYVLAKSLNPETPVSACALSSKMDMKQGRMVYVAPEVFIADMAIIETFNCHLNLPCGACGIYVDAKTPGLQAVSEKLMRCLGLGLFSNLTGMHGTLDQGRVFSPTQMMLDIDLHRFLAAYTAEPVVDEDTLGLKTILEVGWSKSDYLMHEHTLRHMREIWSPLVFGKTPGVSPEEAEEKICLDRARQSWQDNLVKYQPPDHPDDFLKELRRICEKARRSLS